MQKSVIRYLCSLLLAGCLLLLPFGVVGAARLNDADWQSYAALLGLSPEEVRQTVGETPQSVDEGGWGFREAGFRLWFTHYRQGVAEQLFTDNRQLNFKGAKIGDDLAAFTAAWGTPVDQVPAIGVATFADGPYRVSVYYNRATKQTFAVYLYKLPGYPAVLSKAVFPENAAGIDFSWVPATIAERTPDAALECALAAAYGETPQAGGYRYVYRRIDLNDDGQPEVIVYPVGAAFRGNGGGSALVLTPSGDAYRLVTRLTLVRLPIIVSKETSNGWHNLIMEVSGGGVLGFFAELRFDGETYPANPSLAPAVPQGAKIIGTAILADSPEERIDR